MNPIEHLYFWARVRPDDAAIQRLTGTVTWRELLLRVRGVACKLRRMGIRPNQIAMTWLNSQPDWIVTLALMHEGVISCATPGVFPGELNADWVLSGRPLPPLPSSRVISVDDAWLDDLPQVPQDFRPHAFAGEDSLFRLVLTSGTTGQSKVAEFSLGSLLRRCECMSAISNAYAAELCLLRLASGFGFVLGLRRLLRGQASYFAAESEIVDLISTHGIECLSGSPHQLGIVIGKLQGTSRRLPSLKMVWYSGGVASPHLLENMRRMFCPTVVCHYGSTEVGPVSYHLIHDPNHRPGMAGYVVPEVKVQIVDDQHRPLAIDAEGMVRLHSAFMASGYYRNPAATEQSFRDGWFYPGDRGKLLANGMLELTGRESELINRGGAKVSPVELDSSIQSYGGILDVATFGFENQQGIEDICAAIVVANDFNMEAFQLHLTQTFPKHKKPSLIIRLEEIPRNQMGKPLRSQMREQFGDVLRQQRTTGR